MLDKRTRSQGEARNKQFYKSTIMKESHSEDRNTNLYKLTIDTLEQYQKEDSGTSKSI